MILDVGSINICPFALQSQKILPEACAAAKLASSACFPRQLGCSGPAKLPMMACASAHRKGCPALERTERVTRGLSVNESTHIFHANLGAGSRGLRWGSRASQTRFLFMKVEFHPNQRRQTLGMGACCCHLCRVTYETEVAQCANGCVGSR